MHYTVNGTYVVIIQSIGHQLYMCLLNYICVCVCKYTCKGYTQIQLPYTTSIDDEQETRHTHILKLVQH